jgi:hypothetical protein
VIASTRRTAWLLAGLLAACSRHPADVAPAPPHSSSPTPAASPQREFAGWYMEHGQARTFLACGAPVAWSVAPSARLEQHARAFGLSPDTPVYVRLRGTHSAGDLVVAEVAQFGSATPVRDCPLAGVVLPAE